jgi:hypothetical protein
MNNPVVMFVLSLVALWLAAQAGVFARKARRATEGKAQEDFTLVLGATLTLLGLIIGFTFSMAVNRYDQRKNLEEGEANAIGTEYLRADLLPAADAAKVRGLLKQYLDQRMLYYRSRDAEQLRQIKTDTERFQNELWSAVAGPAVSQPTPVSTLVAAGMNDVLNSEGYTQAEWRNPVPTAAWILLMAIATFCNVLLGYGAHGRSGFLMLVLPIALAISFFLIADIDSPRGGVIRVLPQNLESLAGSLRGE